MAGRPLVHGIVMKTHLALLVCRALSLLTLSAVMLGCAPSPPTVAQRGETSPAAPKRIVAAISGEPKTVYALFGQAGVRGADALNALVNSGFSTLDGAGSVIPLLAEAVPSVENGLWTVDRDGTMETIWRIREGARWHDGMPLTPDDFVFTAQVLRDRDLPFTAELAALRSLRDVEARDTRTVVAHWNGLYANADRVFGVVALPLPKHLLEPTYLNAKDTLTDLPYWRDSFVGNGPYKISAWSPGSSMMFSAFDEYPLGRPRIDTIEMRFVLDANTLVSQVLAGDIEITLGRSFSPEQGALVRQRWQEGRVYIGAPSSALNIWPQFKEPSPSIIGDVRFRKALYQALDRDTMAESLESGLVPRADSWLLPTLPEYKSLEHLIVRYSYDPRIGTRAIEGLGFTRGVDGMFRDANDQPLKMEVRSITLPDINARTQLVVRDQWQQVGVTIDSYIIPPQDTDPALTRNFPGFLILRIPADVIAGASAMHSRTPPRGGYTTPDFDSLIERFELTIARASRLEIAGQIVHEMTDQLTIVPLFYDPGIGFVKNRMRNVPALGDAPPWNVQEWDVSP